MKVKNGSLPELCIFSHLFALHFICNTFAFHLHFAQPPELVYLHYISLALEIPNKWSNVDMMTPKIGMLHYN